jgi:elongation factor P
MKATDLRPGYACKIDGKLYVITKFEHRTPGNLRAFIQVKLKDVNTGLSIERRLASNDELEVTTLDRRAMEYLYPEGDSFVFMDIESYEQYHLHKDIVGEAMQYLRANSQTIILMNGTVPLLVELPSAVELLVTETEPGVKNATATNVMKEAILETGLKTRVPQFIGVGETVKIATEDGAYMSRAQAPGETKK